LTFAIAAAYMMAELDRQYQAGNDGTDLLKKLITDIYPPSVSDLAQLFGDLSNYGPLRGVANDLRNRWPSQWKDVRTEHIVDLLRLLVSATGLSDASGSLTNISGYYETASGRTALWNNLARIFQDKRTPTPTHTMVARAAKHYLYSQMQPV